MITTNSDGTALSAEFLAAVAQPLVNYDMALVMNGERLSGGLGRMTLSFGAADDDNDSSAGIAVGGVFSAVLDGQLVDCGESVINQQLEVRIGVDIGGGTYEYVTVATMTVIWSRVAGNITSIQAVGSISADMTGVALDLAAGYYSASTLAAKIATQTGVSVNLGAFATTNQQIHVDTGWTCRRALEALAFGLGGFAAERGNGSVIVAPIPATHTYTIEPDIMRVMPQLADSGYSVDGLTVTVPAENDESQDVVYTFGDGDGLSIVDEWATASTAAALWSNVSQISYWPGSVTLAVLDPRIESTDMVRATADGNSYDIPAINISATFDGGYFGTISATAPAEAAQAAIESGPMAYAVGEAKAASQRAESSAQSALESANTAATAAASAVADASTARQQATTAVEQAGIAIESASAATNSLSDVERVVGTLNWIAEHGRYVAETSSTLVDGRVYYTRSSSEPYVYTVVGEPDVSEISSYYYLVVDESVQNYINSHVWIDTDGLNVAYENNETGTKTVRTGWRIGSVFELLRDSVSWFKLWVENNVAKMRLGRVTSGHVVLDDSGLEVFDNDNNTAVSVAEFGLDGAQIGRSGESHLNLDYHSMQMVDRNGNVYFWVSDLTDREGYITETFYGDGNTREFLLVDDIEQGQDEWYMTVSVDGDAVTSGFTRLTNGVRFASPPSYGSVVEIRYLPTTSNIKAYTIGQRRGKSTIGIFSIAEGYGTAASGNYSHAEGYNTTASDEMSHAEGYGTTASDDYSHAEGYNTTASGIASHAEGSGTKAWGDYTHAEGYGTRAENACSHAEGENTRAGGFNCHAEGRNTEASGNGSHAEGYGTKAYADNSHAEGEGTTVIASCSCGHAEGYGTRVENNRAHAEGSKTTASGGSSHAEGSGTTASGGSSHAEGGGAIASGYLSHAEGDGAIASGYRSHAQNYGTIAASASQTALGKYNVEDASGTIYADGTYAVIVGNGTADDARSNALAVDWNGNALIAGEVQDMSGNARYLPLSGGTLTGNVKIKSAGTRGTTPSANQYRDYEFVDSDNKRLSIVESVIQTSANGDANMLRLLVLGHYTSEDDYGGITIKKTNGNTGNVNMYFDANTGELTGFKMSADRITDGTLPVGRGGTGQTGVTKSTLTQAQAFGSVTSGVTVSNVYVAKWGEVMTLQVTFSYNAARNDGANLTIGTLKSAYRPAYLVGGGSNAWAGYVANNGAVSVRNVSGAQIAANTSSSIGFTFVLA